MMISSPDFVLWFVENRSRFFLVPNSQTFKPGPLIVNTLDERTAAVDPDTLTTFEIREDQARRWAKDQLGQTLDELKEGIDEKLADLRRQLEEKDQTPVTENTTVTRNAGPALFGLLKKLPGVIGNSLSGEDKRVEAAKDTMAGLQRRLKEAGIDLDDRFTKFPDRLADLRKDFEEQRAARKPATNEPPSDKQ